MPLRGNNYAFIDSQNLNLAIRGLGWKLDFRRFRIYLADKYEVAKAFLFIGYIESQGELYKYLQNAGFICIFKPTLQYKNGSTKGNCDAELVLQTMIEYENYDRAVIVSGNGDFYCIVKYLLDRDKLKNIIIPNRLRFSALLKFEQFRDYLRYMNDLEDRLAYKKRKTP
jgi:uncharacterized LabA/DUF88 family protein